MDNSFSSISLQQKCFNNIKRKNIELDCSSSDNEHLLKKYKATITTTTTTTTINTNTNTACLFNELLSVELMVKIFGMLDPFSTPLIFVCKEWYSVLINNQLSLWRDLKVTIFEKRPASFTPKCDSIVSFFDKGYGKSLHSFSISSSFSNKQQQSNNTNSNNSNNTNNNRRNRDNNNNNTTSTTKNNNNCSIFDVQCNIVNFTKVISDHLTTCFNLKTLELILPLTNDQMYKIATNCKYINQLSFNTLLISDNGLKKSFSVMKNLDKLALMASGHANLEFIKRLDKPWSPTSTVSPHSLNIIASLLPNLKSLKFSLLPNIGNHKELSTVESSIIFRQPNDNDNNNNEGITNSNNSDNNNNNIDTNINLDQQMDEEVEEQDEEEEEEEEIIEEQIEEIEEQPMEIEEVEEIINLKKKRQYNFNPYSALLKLKSLGELELMNCNVSNEFLVKSVLNETSLIERLVLYRNTSLTSLKFSCHTIKSLSISCCPMLTAIEINSSSLQELSMEGCESLQSTTIWTPSLRSLSIESCTGTLTIECAKRLRSLSLFECRDIDERSLESIINSKVPNLIELYVYLERVENLRIASTTLKKLDIEAWCGIRSCVLDCPKLREFKASESTLDTLYLKANHIVNIELDFCDSLRTILIDLLSCKSFSFTQNHPTCSNFNVDLGNLNLNNQNYNISINNEEDGEEVEEEVKEKQQTVVEDVEMSSGCSDDGKNKSEDQYLCPTSLFFQSQFFIQNCTILSGNIVGRLATNSVNSLSVELKSFSTFSYDVVKIHRLNTYREVKTSNFGTVRFVPIGYKQQPPSPSQQQ